MASLTGRYPSATYGGLLNIDNSNLGIDTTLRSVQDGLGNTAPIQLATNYVNITALKYNGNIISTTGAMTIGGAFTTTSTVSITGAFSTDDAVTFSGANAVTFTTSSGTTNITIPAVTDTMVTLAASQTLTNKTLTSPVISTIVNTGTLTLPTSTDTLVGRATTDTLTNKTLTSPVISTISNSGTITIPTGTRTLATLDGTETLTNKTITGAKFSSIADTNGNSSLIFTATSSAVNQLTIDNAATGNNPIINATGSDSNISVGFKSKGLGGVVLNYSTTGQDPYIKFNRFTGGVATIQVSSVNSTVAYNFPNSSIDDWIVQRVSTETSAVATGTTSIPVDDTIPQNTEGDEYMTQLIYPKNANNILVIEVKAVCSLSTSGQVMTMALFQDSTANALAAVIDAGQTINFPTVMTLTHIMTAGSISGTTFKVRVGRQTSGTVTFNGNGGNRLMGGVMSSSIIIREYSG